MRGQTSNACPTCCWLPDQQWQVDDVEKFRRTHPASSDADRAHPGVGQQMPSEPSVIRFYRRAARCDGRAAAPTPTVAGNGATGSAPLRKVGAHAGDRRAAQRGWQQSVNRREFSTCRARQRTAHPAGRLMRDAYPGHPPDDQRWKNRFEPMMLPVGGTTTSCSLLASFAVSLLAAPASIATLGHGSPAHTRGQIHRGTGALADGGHRRRGERRGSDQPSHTQHGLLSCI